MTEVFDIRAELGMGARKRLDSAGGRVKDAPCVALFDNQRSRLIGKAKLARLLDVSDRTIERWVAELGLPRIKIGYHTVRFSVDEVEAWLTSRWRDNAPKTKKR